MTCNFDDVLSARERIAQRVFKTPVLRVPALDELAGVELFLKAENLQRIGAFKARGALNAVLAMPEQERRRGLVTYSSGNHGQAVALAGREVGASVHVVMPEDAPAIKIEAVRALGAQVTFAGRTTDDRLSVAKALVEATGAAMVPPFEDACVIAGQGTATLELMEQSRELGAELDCILVPVGGGGLLAGACVAASGWQPKPRIGAAEPEAADAFRRSFLAKERVAVAPGPTLADGLRPVRVGALNFEIAMQHVAFACAVPDSAIVRAMIALLVNGKLLVEPSGACALAAALERMLPPDVKRVGVVLSGGNVSPELLHRALGEWLIEQRAREES